MRSPLSLLLAGLGVLGVSLLLNIWRMDAAGVGPNDGYAVLTWATQATMFIGSGLVVAGAALRVLQPSRSGDQHDRRV